MSLLTVRSSLPGLILCAMISLGALLLEHVELMVTGHRWLEGLVLAILLGTALRTIWTPPQRFDTGIQCAAKTILELAVALMGATISLGTILAAGLPLMAGIVATVFGAIAASFLLGRVFGLPSRIAMLVACGNAICGNSAIAAVAPTIDADSKDVATAIAFTAVLGVVVVLVLPAISGELQLSPLAGGALAGLTVYAVPQVLAAAGSMGPAALQIGTVVKLVRVLMLGPVVTCLSLFAARRANRQGVPDSRRAGITHFLPPFIIAFLLLALLRSLGALPDMLVAPAGSASGMLTVLAMAGLGLGVDLRSVWAAGPRVICVVVLSLIALGVMALSVLRFVGLA
ncbi:putative sulfate exporter family transporter [Sphingobium sp.]|uniref:YeiH family protein n=1 Tax=Sphingobium sp. TaxID=1912891 RepID=UPI0028BE76E3|nr:putative sulfate exporter family transporter [Sphingobium sp.]